MTIYSMPHRHHIANIMMIFRQWSYHIKQKIINSFTPSEDNLLLYIFSRINMLFIFINIAITILVFCVALLLRSLYCFYCKRHFEECHYTFSFNIEQFREMFAFAGWSLVGNLGFSFKDQLSSILLNLFLVQLLMLHAEYQFR